MRISSLIASRRPGVSFPLAMPGWVETTEFRNRPGDTREQFELAGMRGRINRAQLGIVRVAVDDAVAIEKHCPLFHVILLAYAFVLVHALTMARTSGRAW